MFFSSCRAVHQQLSAVAQSDPEFVPILLQGVGLTILVTLGSLVLSTLLGLFWALMRVSGVRALSGVSAGLINLIRGIPIIVLVFYLYFVMPDFCMTLPALQAPMRLAQDDEMVNTLAPDRSDQPFGKAVLPRRGWCSRLVPDAHGAQSARDDSAIDL